MNDGTTGDDRSRLMEPVPPSIQWIGPQVVPAGSSFMENPGGEHLGQDNEIRLSSGSRTFQLNI